MIQQTKKDIHNRIKNFKNALEKLENNDFPIPENKELILRFIRDCRLGKTLKNRQKKIIGEARCLKYIQILKKISHWLDKPFNEVKQEDIEKLIENLENNQYTYDLKSKSGKIIKTKSLAHSTKLDYKKSLIKFYKWLYGNNRNVPELVDWIDTYDIAKEIPAIRREEVEKLAATLTIRDKAIVMALFDSGARAEEFLNIKMSDLSKADGIFKVRIVHSKTKPRTIHLPIASQFVEMWMNVNEIYDSQEYLFTITYEGLRMMLHRVGKRVLKKSITPHLLRHSSATYYANLLNHQQLCYRYGWTMASKMPNRYLDREGIFEKESVDVVKKNDISTLEDKNKKLEEELSLIKQTNESLALQFNEMNEKYNKLFQGKDFMKLLMHFAQNKDNMLKEIEGMYGNDFDVVVP
jgi:site-specific recombinase XerD